MTAATDGSAIFGRRGDVTKISRAPHRLLLLSSAFASGIALGQFLPAAQPTTWLVAAMCCLVLSAIGSRRAPASSVAILCFLCLTSACLGTAWSVIRLETLGENDLAAWIGDESRLVRVEGIARASPTVREYTAGSLGRFDYRSPASIFPMKLSSLVTTDDERIPVTGNVLVRVGETISPFRPGDRITTMGHLLPFDPPRNPGEFDAPALARALGQAGTLNVTSRELVIVTPAERPRVIERWISFRETLHRRAAGWLLAHLPATENSHRAALLKALLLGQREPDLDGMHESFQRLGIAHLLAISGLHLGIVAGFIVLILRMFDAHPRTHAWVIIAVVLGYLALVEVRMPVARAGIMTIAICLGLAFGRRLNVGSMVALSAALLLLWRPDQILNAGFQLSFGVVLGLIYLGPVVHRRLPFRRAREPATTAEFLGGWLRTAFAVAITSWLIATPIVMYHFGFIAPLGILLSVPAVPLVALLLASGYLKIVLEILLPSAALLLSVPLSIFADVLVAVVLAIDALPGTVWHVPFPTAAWTFAALVFAVALATTRWSPRNGASLLAVLLVLTVWLYVPRWAFYSPQALRIDMLAVGHGACFVLRSGGETLVFDAGSISRFDIGDRTLIPALRRLHVTQIDTIAISHPHVDHYGAVIELVDAFGADRVLTTHQFLERARQQPLGPVAHVLDGLTDRYVLVEPIVKGETIKLGEATLTWLHPPRDLAAFQRDNEHSMVIRVDYAGRTVLLTGDVEREGLAHLAKRKKDLRACVVELPHHGSYNDLAAAFVSQLDPVIALQSSSRTQWHRGRERWPEVLAGAEHLVTYRDGACSVIIRRNGTIEFTRFLERGRP